MVTFRSCDLKLQTVAVLWTLFGVVEILSQNCTFLKLRKVSIELPRFAVLASVHRTATVSSFDPRKKVRIELQTVAVLWTLFKTAIYGRCAQVLRLIWMNWLKYRVFQVHCQKVGAYYSG